MSITSTITELVEYLNTCRDEYYNNNKSLISDKQYDDLFDKLQDLENSTGIILSNSPTQSVGYTVRSKLPKVEHKEPLLSLDKCHTFSEVKKFCGDDCVLFMYKVDGLTCQLTYKDGELIRAETRGNGFVGEDITHNAVTFLGVPKTIPIKDEIRITGEACITRKDFAYLSSKLGDEYKNPRNLASGSVRQLDSNICAKRKVRFIVWNANDLSDDDSMFSGLQKAERFGFTTVHTVVPRGQLTETKIETIINNMVERNKTDYIPIDGIVIMFDSISYGKSLGCTSHHFRNGIAYKFYNDTYETTLTGIDFTIGKTGVLTPTAIFESVNIDGTDVSRASVHNISILQKFNLCIGDEIEVCKCNEIIPQVKVNNTKHDLLDAYKELVPTKCPCCGADTEIRRNDDSDTLNLYCTNKQCKGVLLKKLAAFVSRDAMNIDGLSEKTLSKFIDLGFVKAYSDIYTLCNIRNKIVCLDWFGDKSTDSLLDSIEKSKRVSLDRFILALNIDGIGKQSAKDLAKFFNYNINNIRDSISNTDNLFTKLQTIDGFGEIVARSVADWFSDSDNVTEFNTLCTIMTFEESTSSTNKLSGMNFVITGKLNTFANRDELVSIIEKNGGTVQSSVSSTTTYLINNDVNSTSSKNKKAKELGVKIISENEFSTIIGNTHKTENTETPKQNKIRKRGLF